MGLVIFAPTPSFACEKMRLLLTHTHSWTHIGYSIFSIYRPCHAFIIFFPDSLSRKFRLALFSLFLAPLSNVSQWQCCVTARLPFCWI